MIDAKKITHSLLVDIRITPVFIHLILCTLFFVSGVAALIYQVMWQRMLFVAFGVDLTSITIVVSVFMFGLGMGSLLGGYVAEKAQQSLLLLYLIIEVGIGFFGFISPYLIESVSNYFIGHREFITMFISFLLLAFPTLLMGATFPILVEHINRWKQNVGQSVGMLYFANTLGGAVGAFFSGFVLLYVFDIVDAIYCAALLNIITALAVLILFRKE